MESVVKQPVAQSPQSGESGGQCRYALNPCVRQIIDIRGMTVGAENNKMGLAQEAGWLVLFRRFYDCSLCLLCFIVFITHLIVHHSSPSNCI